MNIEKDNLARAAKALLDGHLVAIPTETVYGLGANAVDESAVARIYQVKNRPSNHPLIIHVSSIEQAKNWAKKFPGYADILASKFWPGPMTLVLERSALAQNFITGGQASVALRIPSHPLALELLGHFESIGGSGVAAPSANRFGKVSPTQASAVFEELGAYLSEDDMILDGGDSSVGIESTIIDCTGEVPKILRPGAITVSMIEDVTGLALSNEQSSIRVSGSHSSHYAPRAKVVLDVPAEVGDGLIALADLPTPKGVVRLAGPKDVTEYAKLLYSALRKADSMGLNRVVAITPSEDEFSVAIRDRLKRASSSI